MPPRGSSWSRAKFDRCVTKVKRRGGAYNPYAVCTAQAKRSRRVHRNGPPVGMREEAGRYRYSQYLLWETRDARWKLDVDIETGEFLFQEYDVAQGRYRKATGRLVGDGTPTMEMTDAALRKIGLDGRLRLEEMMARVFELAGA